MIRMTKWLLLALLLVALGGPKAHAQVINATNCSSAAVQTALNSVAADGTTVVIPAGTCTWSTTVSYSQKYSTVIQGQTTISGTCAPGGSCTPTDNTTITLTVGGTAVQLTTLAGKSLRVTGLTIISSSGASPGYGKINIGGGSTSLRIDHNHFDDQTGGNHTFNVDQTYGVFDHNFFDSSNSANTFFIQPTINGPDGNANVSWTQPENFGSASFLFVENNLFQHGTFAFDCNYGARFVFRFNIVGFNTRIQTHGVGSGQERRGCRAMDVYQNTFNFSASPNGSNTSTYFSMLVDYETGTGMWWGNSMSGFQSFLRQDNVRSNSSTYAQNPTPGGWGYCGTQVNGTGSAWDGSSSSQKGYPCLDQIGHGAGDLLVGSFPNKVNQRTGTMAYPNQALVPTYAWANTVNSIPNLSGPYYWNNFGGAQSTENTDYYLQLPNPNNSATFNGTAGIGQGTLASRPSTCTPFVGYWATDQGNWNQSGGGQGVLYQCTATNTWTPYYTPYNYPHPLTQGLTSSVASPTNLQVVVQ